MTHSIYLVTCLCFPEKTHEVENGEKQNLILITGVTGFLGSSLAARFLQENASCRILALSRNDPDGSRTLDAIENAAHGFQISLALDWQARVKVAECDFTSLEKFESFLTLPETRDLFGHVKAVWNCAAQMSYSPKKLSESVLQNVGITTKLYEHIRQNAKSCRRFYHVSTAYTAGMKGGSVAEKIHTHPLLINGYQTSKWGAELALAHLSREKGATPVTLFRPAIIMGHRKTGWSNGHPFGFYMFLETLRRARLAGSKCIRIDVDPEQKPNVIPIEEVVEAAITLTARENSESGLEIFHVANSETLTTRQLIDTMANATEMQVKYEKPKTFIDRQIDKGIAWNREFASTTWNFDTQKLRKALGGTSFCANPLTTDEVLRACHAYLKLKSEFKSELKLNNVAKIRRGVRMGTRILAPYYGLAKSLLKRGSASISPLK